MLHVYTLYSPKHSKPFAGLSLGMGGGCGGGGGCPLMLSLVVLAAAAGAVPVVYATILMNKNS